MVFFLCQRFYGVREGGGGKGRKMCIFFCWASPVFFPFFSVGGGVVFFFTQNGRKTPATAVKRKVKRTLDSVCFSYNFDLWTTTNQMLKASVMLNNIEEKKILREEWKGFLVVRLKLCFFFVYFRYAKANQGYSQSWIDSVSTLVLGHTQHEYLTRWGLHSTLKLFLFCFELAMHTTDDKTIACGHTYISISILFFMF